MTTYHFIQMDNAATTKIDVLDGMYTYVNAVYDENRRVYRFSDMYAAGKIVVNVLDDEVLCVLALKWSCTNISGCTISPILQHMLNNI